MFCGDIPAMIKGIGHLLAACALFYFTGAQWLALQSIAWTRMVITYSEDYTFLEAVQRTFDGSHPCKMCKSIVEEKKNQEQAAVKFALADKKLEALPVSGFALPSPFSNEDIRFFPLAETRLARSSLPETPPPRLA